MLRHGVSAACLALLFGCSSAPSTPPNNHITTPAPSAALPQTADQRFDATWKKFLDEYLRIEPVEATQLGKHDYDGEWPDRTDNGAKAERQFYLSTKAELDAIPRAELSADRRVDAAILDNQLELFAFDTDVRKRDELNPMSYVGVISGGLDPLVTREFAPAPVRAKNLAKRLASVSKVLAPGRARLTRPAKIMTETAIKQIKGLVELVRGGFPELLAAAPSEKDAVLAAAASAAKELSDFQKFLEGDLLARSDGDFRAGKDAYTRAVHLQLDSDVDPEALVADARATLRATQDEMAETARALYPELIGKKQPVPPTDTPENKKKLIRLVLQKIADDRPTNATIVGDATKLLTELTSFVRDKNIVGVPDEPVKVIEMPEYLRGVAIAYCEWPGALEEKGETHVTISPVPADWPADKATSFYREYNSSMLADLIVHEAMPGHYLQAWHAHHYKAVPRTVFDNGSFAEGWAVYGEWVMTSHGFGGPRVKIEREKMLTRVAVNAILDHDIHAGTMDEKAALDLMENEGFQEEGEATLKWTRARVGVGQLSSYFYGYTELMKMRKAAEAQAGFNERAYHDKLLSFGAPTVHEVRAAMGL